MLRRITALELSDFRNYERFSLEPHGELTILVGPNGVGKTNVVEAISLLTRGESFRTTSWQDVVRWGAPTATVSMTARDEDGGRTDVRLVVEDGRRSYRLNDTPKRRVSEVVGTVPAVVFTPEDLRFVKDSADKRRQALDSLGGQISPAYAALRAEYERVLRQRNALLRSGDATERELEPWTAQLIEKGAELRNARQRLLQTATSSLAAAYEQITGGERLSATYQTRDEQPDTATERSDPERTKRELERAQAGRAREERARGTSLVGPHRDDILFLLDGRDARPFASQGQQRSVALAWKLAEVDTVERVMGTTPVLLLDDVMSELDEGRRHRLSEAVSARTQTFVTTTNLGYFEAEFVAASKVVTLG